MPDSTPNSIFDYIVIGAGSAGCAVAGRLSERSDRDVLLLEAGGPDTEPDIRIPAIWPSLTGTEIDWDYVTEAQAHCNGRRDVVPRGKVFGGSSSINAMVYMRGHPAVYDDWARLGNHGWAWDDVLPLFKRSEHQERGASAAHGVGGPINVADLRDPNPLSLAMVRACQELGLPLNSDFNDGSQTGFGLNQVTQKDGERHSAADGYLRPALARPNFTAIPFAHVTRLTIQAGRCSGALYMKDGESLFVEARREVILCAGAINSPQILMLSGIGPGPALHALGVEVKVDLPGVGENYQDHLMVPVSHQCRQPISLHTAGSGVERQKYAAARMGALSSNRPEAGGFVRLDPESAAPELQMIFVPDWAALYDDVRPEGHGFSLLPGLVGTKSRGRLTLQSPDPLAPPRIDPNYLAREEDMAVLVAGVKLARRILAAPAFDPFRGDELIPGPAVSSDEDIGEFVRDMASNIYHSAGTCKMGHDAAAVVDHHLRVHGVDGLRVADASIMPFIVNANTNAPCIMIGEKCADLVLETD